MHFSFKLSHLQVFDSFTPVHHHVTGDVTCRDLAAIIARFDCRLEPGRAIASDKRTPACSEARNIGFVLTVRRWRPLPFIWEPEIEPTNATHWSALAVAPTEMWQTSAVCLFTDVSTSDVLTRLWHATLTYYIRLFGLSHMYMVSVGRDCSMYVFVCCRQPSFSGRCCSCLQEQTTNHVTSNLHHPC